MSTILKKSFTVVISAILMFAFAFAFVTPQVAKADDTVVLSIFTSDTPNGEKTLVKEYTQSDLETLAATDSASGVQYYSFNRGTSLNVYGADSYVKLDTILTDCDITLDASSVVTPSEYDTSTGEFGFSSAISYSELQSENMFYPNYTATDTSDQTDAVEVPAVLALSYGSASSATDTAGTLASSITTYSTDSTPRYFMGNNESHSAAGRRLVSGVGAITVSSSYVSSSYGRLSGTDRYETMGKILEEGFDSAGNIYSNRVIVTSGENFPDALAAAGYAGLDFSSGKYTKATPIVITSSDSLDDTAKEEIEMLMANTSTDVISASDGTFEAIVIGGESAVSADTYSEISDIVGSDNITRISGSDRAATAVAVYNDGASDASDTDANGSWGDTAIIATGYNFADALSASSMAYANKMPIFFTDSDGNLSSDTEAAIEDGEFDQILILGGTGAVSQDASTWASTVTNIRRLSGSDRYSTSSAIADYAVENAGLSYSTITVATGSNFPDALCAGPLAGMKGGPVLLVDNSTTNGGTTVSSNIADNVSDITGGYVIGGTAAVSADIYSAIQELAFGA
ncbi:MAG: cell wall-binding repeat-containing protein [Coriobacteriales bacterium]|jgi:putative cell wall-binding protein